ncbi:MAG: valine--tRNA ligase [Ignavibacteria bacterium]|jgi:valyl-tRNA synthetase|nr:valine--tRNA ligase [Ignavibacteria bacterium]
MREFPPKYNPKEIEEKWRNFWDTNKLYESKVNSNKIKYSVVIPPPNVTGMLHIGHILNNTIQDIYCRWKRMHQFEVCWVPGTDHAGIATQIKVEQELKKEGKSKYDFTREEFVSKIWDWKVKYGGIILNQLKQLGVSVDWSRERFTLDEGLSTAVKEVFVDLYKKGHIYKGKRIINWDCITQTALSDDEISYTERNDKLYYIKYPLTDSEEYMVIATTRPETMLGDSAIAVNPLDKRYNRYKNKSVILPIVNKTIPIIFDEYVDMKFGTGALKVTPAHDINDFELGTKHKLEFLNILSKDGKINENGFHYSGMTVEQARKKILNELDEKGYLVKEETYVHNVAISERSGAIIEPLISDQWFIAMKELTQPAIKVVKEGKIKFHPEKWTKTYYHWLDNVKDWCISRQLWWGHQIPIWYHKETGEIYCDTKPPDDINKWIQDPDVLDTWFSSWLWPFSVFGWKNSPEDKKNKDLSYYYPTDFLSTAPEIIFLWVARMIISGLEYMYDIPFKDVYFHSTVRDGKGRKMSKSLGNSPDPLDLMDKYGTDALRFTIVYLAPLGSDVLFDEKNTEIGRNFITKLWNAGRFLVMTRDKISDKVVQSATDFEYDAVENWIDSRFNNTLLKVEKYLNSYRLNDYTKELYNFVWSDYCDWYIELLKIKVQQNPNSAKALIERSISIYKDILKLLHPVIPFVTEEIWNILSPEKELHTLSFEKYPVCHRKMINDELESKFVYIEDLLTTFRNERLKYTDPGKYKYSISIKPMNTGAQSNIEYLAGIVRMIFNNADYRLITDNTQLRGSSGNFYIVALEFAGEKPKMKINPDSQKTQKEIDSVKNYIKALKAKLINQNFLEKAAADVIAKEKLKLKEAEEKLEKLMTL